MMFTNTNAFGVGLRQEYAAFTLSAATVNGEINKER